MEAHVMSVAVLVRYTDDGSGHVYFDNSLLPDPLIRIILTSSWSGPTDGTADAFRRLAGGLQFQPGPNQHWNFSWAGVPYHALRMSHIPILDREEGGALHPQP